ncbi:MAG: anaerobic ribonucleoside-triphosphate reductase activating protein [Erysipelotrichaceae bacterium]
MKDSSILNEISLLYRYIQKYLDKYLGPYNLGSGQIPFLIVINENDGITTLELSKKLDFDKGTASKSISKLEELGYIEIKVDDNDKRIKRLFTTNKTQAIVAKLYEIHTECYRLLTIGVEEERFLSDLNKLKENALNYLNIEPDVSLKIGGLQKITLLDYPDRVACTIFLSGCNLKCPFCHNKDLVYVPQNVNYYSKDEVFEYLNNRRKVLDGVVISGGESLMQENVVDFIREIKDLGFSIKLDTNGFYFDRLKYLIDEKLIDYVAVDIKNCREKYHKTCGMAHLDLQEIEKSVDYLLQGHIDYEFRTTLCKELHRDEDIIKISQWIRGCSKYYLQNYRESENVICKKFTPIEESELNHFIQLLKDNEINAYIRG